MVWLNAANENGNGLYLNIHRIDRRSLSLFSLHGTIGDGSYEGEVLVEVGARVDITFADEWLDRSALSELFRRVDRTDVEAALAEHASELCLPMCGKSQERWRPSSEFLKKHQESRTGKGIDPKLPMIKEGEVFWCAA